MRFLDSARNYFFFSSRRRHTRSTRDWSSDVCSSDLPGLSAGSDEQPSGCRLAASTTPSRTLRTRWPNPDGNAAKESQPHWMTPVVTVTPRLEQEFRYDQRFFSSRRRHTRLTEGVGSLIILDLQR